jgi:hypothetical protein
MNRKAFLRKGECPLLLMFFMPSSPAPTVKLIPQCFMTQEPENGATSK